MSQEAEITHWLHQLQAGDSSAAQRLWDAYFRKMVVVARRKLSGTGRMAADEEDIAISAFKSFCQGLEDGRFQDLESRQEIWKLLVTITLRKAFRLVRDERRQKRGGLATRVNDVGNEVPQLIELVASAAPSPELEAQFAEECERLLALLPAELMELAVRKLEGFTNDEIATQWGRAERTVERKLKLIREIWEHDLASRPDDEL